MSEKPLTSSTETKRRNYVPKNDAEPESSSRRDPGTNEVPGASEVPERFQRSESGQQQIDPNLINETKNQIRALVQEIRDLAASDCSTQDFYQGFLTRTINALASVGGAVWLKNEQGNLQLEYQINLHQTKLKDNPSGQQRHGMLVESLISKGQPDLVGPHSGDDSEEGAANPTDFLIVAAPIATENEPDGLIEIFQRPGSGPTTQRGYLRFLVQMAEIASGFLKNQRLKEFSERQQMWHRLEKLVHRLHNGLNTRKTIYAIANEGRQFVECDRVSVALKDGRRFKIQAVSGLDTIERRAEQIKLLNRLTQTVVKADTPLWYGGDDADLAPQIEKSLQKYVDRSHSKMIAILPLHRVDPKQNSDEPTTRRKPVSIGAIIFEQLSDDRITSSLKRRAEVVQSHSCDALTNAMTHNGVFLMPLWKAIGAVPGVKASGRIPKTLIALTMLAAIIAAMCVIPYDFSLGANGKLVPEKRYEVYAPMDGILKEILVPKDPDAIVEKDQLLAVMANNDLLVEIETLQGELKTEVEHQEKLERTYKDLKEQIDRLELYGEIEKSIKVQESLKNKIALRQSKYKKLEIHAPARGQVVNWQIHQKLERRPVKTGQNLMTVVDPETQWQLELELPERRVEHLIKQQRESEEPLCATFTLASHPGKTYTGKIIEIDSKLDVHSDEGNAVLIRVTFDKSEIPPELLRSGTRVTAKFHCGKRSVGYVLFHELIETVQAKVLFWL